jgi:hypothetical protein
MNDCELLEKAAKAAGYKETRQFSDTCFQVRRPDTLWDDWNPLTDDGDALRLAVKLRLEVCIWSQGCSVCETTDDEPFGKELADERGEDHYAATRRAIVRAAAAVGEKK